MGDKALKLVPESIAHPNLTSVVPTLDNNDYPNNLYGCIQGSVAVYEQSEPFKKGILPPLEQICTELLADAADNTLAAARIPSGNTISEKQPDGTIKEQPDGTTVLEVANGSTNLLTNGYEEALQSTPKLQPYAGLKFTDYGINDNFTSRDHALYQRAAIAVANAYPDSTEPLAVEHPDQPGVNIVIHTGSALYANFTKPILDYKANADAGVPNVVALPSRTIEELLPLARSCFNNDAALGIANTSISTMGECAEIGKDLAAIYLYPEKQAALTDGNGKKTASLAP